MPNSLFVTDTDKSRLTSLMGRLRERLPHEGHVLREGIARAHVVASKDVRPDVVTMNSRLFLEDCQSGALREVTLVYPWDEDPLAGKESVFSPLGSVLLGQQVGCRVDWLEHGELKSAWVGQILFQPEAHGAYYL